MEKEILSLFMSYFQWLFYIINRQRSTNSATYEKLLGDLIKFVSKIINGKGNTLIIYAIFSTIVLYYQQSAFS